MRTFLVSTLLVLTLSFTASAATPTPPQSVWVTPEHPKVGDVIEINAFVYNSSAKSATISVAFTADEKEIATTKVLVAPQTAKVAVVEWQQPTTQTTVTAKITAAVDAGRNSIPELIGTIGSVSAGASSGLSTDGLLGTLKGWFGALTTTIEPWRQRQAKHFGELRDKKKAELGIKSAFDIAQKLSTKSPEAPAAPGEEETLGDLSPQASVPFGDYIVLIYATALAAVFSSVALFYISLILLTLFVLRFILGLFR